MAAAGRPSPADLGGRGRALYLYEPPFIVEPGRPPVPADDIAQVERLVAAGHRSEAVESFRVQAIGLPEKHLAPMRVAPAMRARRPVTRPVAADAEMVG